MASQDLPFLAHPNPPAGNAFPSTSAQFPTTPNPGGVVPQPTLPASFLRRFANTLLDGISTSFIMWPLAFVVSLILGATQEEAAASMNLSAFVALISLSLIVPMAYFLICESVWGRTIGKLATGTKVVDYTGHKPSFGRIFLRTICRYIPFEPFSFLFRSYPRGWHDKISETLVVPVGLAPEAVASMDRNAIRTAKGPHRWAVMLISVLGVLQLLLIPILIFGMAMLFLTGFSEGGIRGQGTSIERESAGARLSLIMLQITSESYRSENGRYTGFCVDTGTNGAAQWMDAEDAIICNDAETSWAASAPLSDGSAVCVDASGLVGTAPRPLAAAEVMCPEGTIDQKTSR